MLRFKSYEHLDRPNWCSTKPLHHFAYRWLDNVRINKYASLIQIYDAVQELWAFSLTDHNRLKWCTANPRHQKGTPVIRSCLYAFVYMQNLIKIYHALFKSYLVLPRVAIHYLNRKYRQNLRLRKWSYEHFHYCSIAPKMEHSFALLKFYIIVSSPWKLACA